MHYKDIVNIKNKKYSINIRLLAPVRNMEKKILMIPMIFMLISAICFGSDLYFFINHEKNLEDLQRNDGGIIFVHFLIVR